MEKIGIFCQWDSNSWALDIKCSTNSISTSQKIILDKLHCSNDWCTNIDLDYFHQLYFFAPPSSN